MWRLPRALLPIYGTTLVDTLGYTHDDSAASRRHSRVSCFRRYGRHAFERSGPVLDGRGAGLGEVQRSYRAQADYHCRAGPHAGGLSRSSDVAFALLDFCRAHRFGMRRRQPRSGPVVHRRRYQRRSARSRVLALRRGLRHGVHRRAGDGGIFDEARSGVSVLRRGRSRSDSTSLFTQTLLPSRMQAQAKQRRASPNR